MDGNCYGTNYDGGTASNMEWLTIKNQQIEEAIKQANWNTAYAYAGSIPPIDMSGTRRSLCATPVQSEFVVFNGVLYQRVDSINAIPIDKRDLFELEAK